MTKVDLRGRKEFGFLRIEEKCLDDGKENGCLIILCR